VAVCGWVCIIVVNRSGGVCGAEVCGVWGHGGHWTRGGDAVAGMGKNGWLAFVDRVVRRWRGGGCLGWCGVCGTVGFGLALGRARHLGVGAT
jgi:hypothetical protein